MVHCSLMTTATDTHKNEVPKATVNGLAIVGFIALILGGIFLAIYAAGYVPETISRLAGAVVLSDDTDPETQNEEPTTPVAVPETPVVETPRPTTPQTGGPLLVTPPTAVSPNPPYVVSTGPQLYGLPDLAIVSIDGGYMRGSTFVEDNEVPSGRDAAVRFTVQNLGTNVVSDWRLRIDVEDEDTATGMGSTLYPNGTQAFTVRVDNPREGNNLQIQIDLDYQNRIAESNERNNDEEIELDIE